MERTEREINLLDLLETICKKWRVIILFLIIGLIVGGAAATAQALYNKSQSSADALTAKTEKTLAEAESELAAVDSTGELKKIADNNVGVYLYKEELYGMQEEYLEKSLYYSIDEQSVAKNMLTYHIDNHYSVEYPVVNAYNNIGDVTQYYIESVASYSVYDRIISEVYPGSEYKYIRELISAYAISTGNIKVDIVTESADNTEKISEIIQDEMKRITEGARNLYGEVDSELQINQSVVENDIGMAESHAGALKKAIDLSNEMGNIAKSMNNEQLAYFEAQISLGKINKIEAADEKMALISMVSKKTVVVGGLVGMVLSVIGVAGAYVFSGTIKTADDLVNVTNAVLIGDLKEKKTANNPIDKLINKIFHRNNRGSDADKKNVVTMIISETLKSNNAKSVCIVASMKCKEDKSIIEICEDLRNNDIDIYVADEFMTNSEGMKFANKADSVIVCEKICKSEFVEIEKEIRLLKVNRNEILGCIVL